MPGLLTLPSFALRRAQHDFGRALERVASGQRIVRAADDPAGLAVSENLDARARSAVVVQRNLNDGLSLLHTVDGSASEVANILKRLRELAVQSASETLHDDERAYLDAEAQELLEEVDRIANTTSLFGQRLTDGSLPTVDVQAGVDQGDTITLVPGDLRNATLGTAALDLSSVAGAGAALGTLDAALDTVNGQRAVVGASMRRLEGALRLAQNDHLASTAAAGRIRDADLAHEAAEMARDQLLVQTGTMAMRQLHAANRAYMEALLG